MSFKPRINTRSEKVAVITKEYLERKFKTKMHIAVSSRNHIMLDFDCPGKEHGCLVEALAVAKGLTEVHGGVAKVYETPHGFHVIHYKWLSWKEVKKVLETFKEAKLLAFIDRRHIEASLWRGYMTLRANQKRVVAVFKDGERVE